MGRNPTLELPYDEVYDEDGELVSSPRLVVREPWTDPIDELPFEGCAQIAPEELDPGSPES
jgi:hypothetical protein